MELLRGRSKSFAIQAPGMSERSSIALGQSPFLPPSLLSILQKNVFRHSHKNKLERFFSGNYVFFFLIFLGEA